MKKVLLIFGLLLVSMCFTMLFSCTVFYIERGNQVYAGNNEDWKDPYSKFWFYPAENGKYGWIKFGWGSGFPQGGVNDQGLFWDATSCTYLEMPDSEKSKQKLSTPVMQIVIEKCRNVEEAISIFADYYCEDQYRAQYLVGDSNSNSMIVEGDNIIQKAKDFQVITNFYHSHPELGGYPCERYETAVSMIENSAAITPWFVGSVLDATHQEGKYPTRYSMIYDLSDLKLFIFHNHNFQEFLELDILSELSKGYREMDIQELFSGVSLLFPFDGQEKVGNDIEIAWKGKSCREYQVLYARDPDFSIYSTIGAAQNNKTNSASSNRFLLIFLIPVSMPLLIRRIRIKFPYQMSVVFILLLITCSKEPMEKEDTSIEMNIALKDLEPNTTYYWKIKAWNPDVDGFFTESLTRSFRTGS